MKSYGEQILAIDNKAMKHIRRCMMGIVEYRIVNQNQIDEDQDFYDDTVGISFHDKHGPIAHGHVTRIFKNKECGNELYIEGVSYNTGQKLTMPLDELEAGDISFVADLVKSK